MDYNFYKQCVVCLCVLLPYVLDKAMAGLCGKCQYYNVDIEQCESCVFACTPARNHCRRVCPDWSGCMSTTPPPTTQISVRSPEVTSSPWAWVGLSVCVLLLVIGVYLCKRRHCGGGCDAPTTCYEHCEKEVRQQVPLVVVQPEGDANKGPCDSHNPLTPTGTCEDGV